MNRVDSLDGQRRWGTGSLTLRSNFHIDRSSSDFGGSSLTAERQREQEPGGRSDEAKATRGGQDPHPGEVRPALRAAPFR